MRAASIAIFARSRFERLRGAFPRITFLIDQPIDPFDQLPIFRAVLAPTAPAFPWFERADVLFPIAPDVRFDPQRLRDFANGAQRARILAVVEGRTRHISRP